MFKWSVSCSPSSLTHNPYGLRNVNTDEKGRFMAGESRMFSGLLILLAFDHSWEMKSRTDRRSLTRIEKGGKSNIL